MTTGASNRSAAACCTAEDADPPPIRMSAVRRHAQGGEPVEGVAEHAEHAEHGGAGEVLGSEVGPGEPDERAARIGQVGRALAVEVRDEGEPAGVGRAGLRQPVELAEVDAEQPRGGAQDPGGVDGRDQRQVAAGGVGEPRHGAAGVVDGLAGRRRPCRWCRC